METTASRVELERDGFAILKGVAKDEEIARIRKSIVPLLHGLDVTRRELGERGSAPQIVEIERVLDQCPELASCGFLARALSISANLLAAPVKRHYDHVIFKPPMNQKETAWHQDAAYGRRLTFSSRRIHWWLPLHDVSEDQGCMRFVPGSHLGPIFKHVRVAATSDALRTNLPEGASTVACPLQQGDATIHLPTTLHYTGPNRTNRSRIALIVQFAARTRLPRFVR
jgi:ectoine hydroxylase-related dioxygenase (phytanoyl-CoA dioxygenase family)